MKFKVGELVKWYLLYGNISIVKDAGYGTIIRSNSQNYGSFISNTYRVFCNDGKILNLEEGCLEKLNKT